MLLSAMVCFGMAFAIGRARRERLAREARLFRVLGTERGQILWQGFPRDWRRYGR